MFSEYKSLIIWVLASAGVMFVISALNMLFQVLNGSDPGTNSNFHMVFYIIFLFPGGYLLTSSMFKDLHDKSKNIYWLTMPGSTFEKMLSRLLISSLLYVILLTLVYPVFAALSELLNLLIFNIRHDFFNPFNGDVMRLIPYYFVTQSIFFAGAAFFRKHPFAKTILSLAGLQMVISILAVILLRVFFGSYFTSLQNFNFSEIDIMNFTGNSMDSVNRTMDFLLTSAKVVFWGILSPFFYILSYFKLSEKEVRDGF